MIDESHADMYNYDRPKSNEARDLTSFKDKRFPSKRANKLPKPTKGIPKAQQRTQPKHIQETGGVGQDSNDKKKGKEPITDCEAQI